MYANSTLKTTGSQTIVYFTSTSFFSHPFRSLTLSLKRGYCGGLASSRNSVFRREEKGLGRFMNDMAERHCGHIKVVHLRYQWWCHQKASSRGATGTLCMDYVARYQVHTVRDTTQEQPHSPLEPLGLDMIPGLESFVDHRWSLEVTKYQVIRPWLEEGLPCVRARTRQASSTVMR